MAYSLDFRKRVFAVKEKEGLTFSETSKRFHVPMNTLFRWQRRIEPKTKRNKPATKIDMKALRRDIRKYPDKFQYERAREFGVTQGAIWFALKRMNISVKKNSVPPKG
jgi:transposase